MIFDLLRYLYGYTLREDEVCASPAREGQRMDTWSSGTVAREKSRAATHWA